MKKKIYDKVNDRSIVCDFSNNSISIIGDYSASSITVYWVVNRFTPDCPCSILITREHAHRTCDSYNKQHNTDIFIVVRRTIFI